jgi:hypothetical protein
MLTKFISHLKKLISDIPPREKYIPVYRVVDIDQINDHYVVKIQIINESNAFPMRPEDILADGSHFNLSWVFRH